MKRRLNLFNVQREGRSAAGLACGMQDGVVAVGNPLDEAESEPDAAFAGRARRIRPIEPLEDMGEDLGRHADSGVADLQPLSLIQITEHTRLSLI
jgi:hypothetical protein